MRIRRLFGRDHQFGCALLVALALITGSTLLDQPHVYATVPNGFTDQLVTSVGQPTDIAFTPSGTMLATSQAGQLYKRTGSTTTKVLDLSGKICTDSERGLLGVVVDPEFASNSYIYLYYTFNRYNTCERNSPNSPNDRVSRFTFVGSTVSNETVLVDNILSLNGNHNGGGMAFGNDGYLYIGVGDSGCQLGAPSNCAGSNGNSRLKNHLNGKILRVSRNGIAPSSNPFYSSGGTCRTSGSTTSGTHCKETFAWGFRNPFRISSNPNSSGTVIYANDVGQDEWEEIDNVQAGKDYGWNNCEGFNNNFGGGTCGFADTNPLFVYGHGSCNSITGSAFIPNGSWPSSFNNLYFFADYTCGTIWTLKNTGGTYTRTVFASGLGAVTELEFGPYNNGYALFYTDYGSGQIRRISYTAAANRAPQADIDASPSFGALPLDVSFDGRDSSDPDGDSLTYAWDFGDGTSSTSSHPHKTYTHSKDYTVRLTVKDGRGGSDTDTTVINAGNTRPSAEILLPLSTTEFSVGQTIKLKGAGTDAEDDPGTIPSSRMTWEVRLHHDTHYHPYFGPVTGNYLTFQAPAPEDLLAATNSYLEIRLTVRDKTGLGKVVTMNLYPNKVNVTIGSNVPGMKLWIEGQPYTAPATVLTWENNPLTIEAPDQIGPDNQPYLYKSWSDGGTRKHNYDTPASDATVTATFNVFAGFSYPPHADARVSEAYPDRNEGGGTGLSIKGGTGSDYETYIRFKLSGVGTEVTRARLYLYSYEGSVDGPDVYLTSSSWSEMGITWNSRLSPSGGRIEDYDAVAPQSWIALDVTGAIDGDGYVTFLLRSPSSDAASFYSRQIGTSKAPRLVILSNGVGPSEDISTPQPTPSATPTNVATVEASSPIAEPETPVAVPTETALPTETAVAIDTPTEQPTVAEPTATEVLPEASPLPFSETFEGTLDAWVAEGAALVPAAGPDSSTALELTSTGTSEINASPAYIRYGTGQTESLHVAFDVNPVALPNSPVPLVTFTGADGQVIASTYLLEDGSIVARWSNSDSTTLLGSIAGNTWQHIEIGFDAASGAATLTLWVNDSAPISSASDAATNIETILIGSWAIDGTFDLLIDNVALDVTCLGTCPPYIAPPLVEPTVPSAPTDGTPVS